MKIACIIPVPAATAGEALEQSRSQAAASMTKMSARSGRVIVGEIETEGPLESATEPSLSPYVGPDVMFYRFTADTVSATREAS